MLIVWINKICACMDVEFHFCCRMDVRCDLMDLLYEVDYYCK